jgi:FkbM family methyltransferase
MTGNQNVLDALTCGSDLTRIKQCRYGRMLYLRRDKYVGKSLDVYGELCQSEADLFGQVVRPGDTVIEVGANIGAHTVRLSQLAGPEGLVLAFECQRFIYHILCANLALNDIFNTQAYCTAIGSKAGTLRVPPIRYDVDANFGGAALTENGDGEIVTVAKLDTLHLPSARLLKVDVEGMEAEVLNGARTLITRHRPFLYVENDRQDRSSALIALIDAFGYDMWWFLVPLFNPDNYAGNKMNIFPHTICINLFCVPKEMTAVVTGSRRVTGPDDWYKDIQTV